MSNNVLPHSLGNLPRTCIDLFAGAGGLSTGLELAGFNVLFANEIVPVYATSLAQNHPQTNVYVDDIRSLAPNNIRNVRESLGLEVGQLDLVAGGPPCQGFSINAPSRSTSDDRNHLFLNYLDFVNEFRPKVVLIENVPGMVSFSNGGTIRAILDSLECLGYKASVRILYAPHYGVPQMRWRTIFLATRLPFDPDSLYPAPTHNIKGRPNFTAKFAGRSLIYSHEHIISCASNAATTVWDAISDLPVIPNGGGDPTMAYGSEPNTLYQKFLRLDSNALTNHQCAGLGSANTKRLPYIPPGGSWRDIPHELLPEGMKRARRSDHTKRYGRLDPNGIASTILTKCDPHWGAYIHPNQDRVLSVREAARLQSFPDRVTFAGSLSEQYEQVGNAVPPLFARAIGYQIQDTLRLYERGEQIIATDVQSQVALPLSD
ncbi:MAG TPA: DNA cytosine methyltransferase [Noviherbaspirillum sp.]|jgi:DNA (cytosine-5)-methyltransferase 1|uniref:DNA cytosine methyltransferase n=1 Tax=Noviherbaspirillum sp. TaxID=1926288 RepID=UPI002DDC911D|nr:DNA cytosine methyltransferase [Noviherbaspirillum sp.]HEV2610620.1 DNA cytosine methyltransferase [Noviherbaspirillum sp.]